SSETHHNADPQAPFASYKTFAWVTEEPLIQPGVGSVPGSRPADPLLDPLIRDAVERNLKARGYEQLRDPKIADLVVSFSVGARDKIEVDSYPVTAGYRYQVYGGCRAAARPATRGAPPPAFFVAGPHPALCARRATTRVSP